MRRAASSRASGAPMAMTVYGPRSRASAMALRPTGPVPCTSTVSPSSTSERSTAWKAVGSPQPPPMTVSGASPSGRRMMRTPGFR